MNLTDDKIKDWALTVCDQLSSIFQLNIHFKNFKTDELIYSNFIQQNQSKMIGVVSEFDDTHETILLTTDLSAIIGTTTCFFSKDIQNKTIYNDQLTFVESCFSKKIIQQFHDAFDQKKIPINHVKSEIDLNLIHPFHIDDLIKMYCFDWEINEKKYGEMMICHAHIF